MSVQHCHKASHMARNAVKWGYKKLPRMARFRERDRTEKEFDMSILSESAQKRFWAKVDKTATCWLWTAAVSRGYGKFGARLPGTVGRETYYAHRISYELAKGSLPPGMEVDHRCHVRRCVNPAHLRAVTHKQNAENQAGPNSANKSGVRGVYWHKQENKWFGQVQHNRVRYSAGLHADIKDAEAAVVALRNKLHTHNDLDRMAAA